jgi:uncharacterized membrane protein YdjX (TVP38/TMEM64 family)
VGAIARCQSRDTPSAITAKPLDPIGNSRALQSLRHLPWTNELPVTDALIEILKSPGALDFSGILVVSAVFFVCAVIVPVPRTALCLGTGAIFGLSAIPVIVPSTTLGAVAAFLSARYLFAERLHRMVDRSPNLRIVLNAIDAEGWRVVGLMRFAGPILNFLQNLMFGLTRIGLWPFTAATFVCTIPQICLYVYLGALGKEMLVAQTLSPLSLGLA